MKHESTRDKSRTRRTSALVLAALASAAAASTARADSGWTLYFSEENAGKSCPAGERVEATHCSGSYCDNKALYCGTAPAAYSSFRWTSSFSEETVGGRECIMYDGTRGVVTGMDCSGSYCDNSYLRCGHLPAGQSLSGCYWGPWVSEENGGYNTFYNRSARAAQCSGSYCDNMRFLICTQS